MQDFAICGFCFKELHLVKLLCLTFLFIWSKTYQNCHFWHFCDTCQTLVTVSFLTFWWHLFNICPNVVFDLFIIIIIPDIFVTFLKNQSYCHIRNFYDCTSLYIWNFMTSRNLVSEVLIFKFHIKLNLIIIEICTPNCASQCALLLKLKKWSYEVITPHDLTSFAFRMMS